MPCPWFLSFVLTDVVRYRSGCCWVWDLQGVITPWLLQAAFYFMSTYIVLALLPKLRTFFSAGAMPRLLHKGHHINHITHLFLFIHAFFTYSPIQQILIKSVWCISDLVPGDKQPVSELSWSLPSRVYMPQTPPQAHSMDLLPYDRAALIYCRIIFLYTVEDVSLLRCLLIGLIKR